MCGPLRTASGVFPDCGVSTKVLRYYMPIEILRNLRSMSD